MSEDLLEHVSQRVATEQQMPPASRASSRNSRPASTGMTSRGGLVSRDHIVSPHALSLTRPSSRAATASSKVKLILVSQRPTKVPDAILLTFNLLATTPRSEQKDHVRRVGGSRTPPNPSESVLCPCGPRPPGPAHQPADPVPPQADRAPPQAGRWRQQCHVISIPTEIRSQKLGSSCHPEQWRSSYHRESK